MRKTISLIILLLVLASIPLVMFFLSQPKKVKTKAAPTTVLSFNPGQIVQQPGQAFNADVTVDTGDNQISGVTFDLRFNPQILEARDIINGSFLSNTTQIEKIIDNTNGKIRYSFFTFAAGAKKGNGILATVVFKGKSEGVSEVMFGSATNISAIGESQNVVTGKIDASYTISAKSNPTLPPTSTPTHTPVPTATAVPTLNPTTTLVPTATSVPSHNVTLNLKLKFQGVDRQPRSAQNDLKVKIKLTGGGLSSVTDVQTADFTVLGMDQATGFWTGKVSFNVPFGNNYAVLVKGQKHLQKKVCDTKPTESTEGTYRCAVGKINLVAGENNLDFSGIRLLAGDLPTQDGIINSSDLSQIVNCLGKSDEDCLKTADINLDGVVNSMDYSLIINTLSIKYDEEG